MAHNYLYEVLMSEAGHTQETVVTRGFVCSAAKAKTTSVGCEKSSDTATQVLSVPHAEQSVL